MSQRCQFRTHAPQQRHAGCNTIFNHLVGAREQPSWDVKAERLGGLKVDNELQSSWKLDREVGDGETVGRRVAAAVVAIRARSSTKRLDFSTSTTWTCSTSNFLNATSISWGFPTSTLAILMNAESLALRVRVANDNGLRFGLDS
jgi:hypothetical protein